MSKKAAQEENPLVNILVNVLLPTIILAQLSKVDGKFYHIGPAWAMCVALSLPIGYGLWHWLQHKALNVFSCVGLGAILLTGLITIYLWYDESSKPHVALIFGIKEALQPLILGSLFIITHKTATPLFNTFLYNDALFDIPRIEKAVKTEEKQDEYKKMKWNCTLFFFGSFLISAVLNLALAIYFFRDLSPDLADGTWKTEYNEIVGKITGWGFAVIGAPFLIVMIVLLIFLLKSLRKHTGLSNDEILIPR